MPTQPMVDFGSGQPATLNYNVPANTFHTGRRIVHLAVEREWFKPISASWGSTTAQLLGVSQQNDGTLTIDEVKAHQYFATVLRRTSVPPARQAALLTRLSHGMLRQRTALEMRLGAGATLPAPSVEDVSAVPLVGDDWNDAEDTLNDIWNNLVRSFPRTRPAAVPGAPAPPSPSIPLPSPSAGGGFVRREVDLFAEPDPALFIVEVYGLSSFYGDYGAGRTIKTFTLAPGEAATISMKTWRKDTTSAKDQFSMVDSHASQVKEHFAAQVQNETTDKRTQASVNKWSVEAHADASWGFGGGSLNASDSGESHAEREHFARAVSQKNEDLANEVSSKREVSVTSNSERLEERGEESSLERKIKNVNMRRTLNLVFRELNQSYDVKFHLKDIRVAFSTGLHNSWREVPLSGLRGLLREVLQPAHVDEAARRLLDQVSVVFDHDDDAVSVIERKTYQPAALNQVPRFDPVPVTAEAFKIGRSPHVGVSPPKEDFYYRFKRGPLNQGEQKNRVDGVLLRQNIVVMKTDAVIIEALLGGADALDEYAMEIQKAAAGADTLANDKEALALETLRAIQDPAQRAAAWEQIYRPAPKQPAPPTP